jgi:hypothetical protein
MTRRIEQTAIFHKSTTRLPMWRNSKTLLPAMALALALFHPVGSVAAQSASAKNEKLAEIAAMARHNEKCPDVPRQWAIAYLILLVMAPPREDQVEAQERKTLALRREIGMTRWCQLYSVEMEEAYLIYQYAKRR